MENFARMVRPPSPRSFGVFFFEGVSHGEAHYTKD